MGPAYKAYYIRNDQMLIWMNLLRVSLSTKNL